MHAAVVNQLANKRAGTASTKNKALVSGGGAKPWKQKGTGRARTGSTAPRSGGTAAPALVPCRGITPIRFRKRKSGGAH